MSSIFVKHNQPFTIIPNFIINNPNISANTLAVITYLAGKPMGWIARAYDIKKRFGWGDHIWRKVSKELRQLGLLKEVKHAEGTNLYFEMKWDDGDVNKPVDKPIDPPVDFRTVQKPTRGKSTGIQIKNIQNKDLLENKDFLEGHLSVDNPEGLPTRKSAPKKNDYLKNERQVNENERRRELDNQLKILTHKMRM